MKNKSKIFKLVACILLIMGIIFFVLGFQKKNNYNSGEYGDAKNAYVGGDAYNYIINANYFTGYIVLGSTCILSSTIFYVATFFMQIDEKQGKDKRMADKNYDEELPQI